MTKFEKLLQVKNEFQGHIKNPKLIYTYIAPSHEADFKLFSSIVNELPTSTNSFYEILNDDGKVEKIIAENFSDNSELDIYIASNDIHSVVRLAGTLREYIESEKIDFDY